MAYYRPNTAGRQSAVAPAVSALLFIDVQRFNCCREGALYQSLTEEQQQARRRLWTAASSALAVQRLLAAATHPSLLREGGRGVPQHCTPQTTPAQTLKPQLQSEGTRHFLDRVDQCQPLWTALQQGCRWDWSGQPGRRMLRVNAARTRRQRLRSSCSILPCPPRCWRHTFIRTSAGRLCSTPSRVSHTTG